MYWGRDIKSYPTLVFFNLLNNYLNNLFVVDLFVSKIFSNNCQKKVVYTIYNDTKILLQQYEQSDIYRFWILLTNEII